MPEKQSRKTIQITHLVKREIAMALFAAASGQLVTINTFLIENSDDTSSISFGPRPLTTIAMLLKVMANLFAINLSEEEVDCGRSFLVNSSGFGDGAVRIFSSAKKLDTYADLKLEIELYIKNEEDKKDES